MAKEDLSSKFSTNFQNRMLAVAATQPFFLDLYQDVFKPSLFTTQYHRDFSSWIADFHSKYHTTPSKSSLRKILRENVDRESPLYKGYRHVLDLIYELQVEDYEYVKDQIITAAKFQAGRAALLRMEEQLNAGDFEATGQTWTNAMKAGTGAGDIGLNLVTSVNTALMNLEREEHVKTGYRILARKVGQFNEGELTVIVAPPNQGKTAFLGNLAYGVARYDQEVIYYTFEIRDRRILSRFYARMTQIKTKNLYDKIRTVRRSVRRFKVSSKGTIYVKFFPARSASIETLRSHLAMAFGNGVKPKAIFVDYADLVRSSNPKDPPPDRARQTYEDLRALASEFKLHVFTASQSRRSTLYASLIDLDDLSDSWGKAATADNIIPICQTREEKIAGVARGYMAKTRNETSGGFVYFRTKWETLTVYEISRKEYKRIMRRAGFAIPDDKPRGLRKTDKNDDDSGMDKYTR